MSQGGQINNMTFDQACIIIFDSRVQRKSIKKVDV